MENSRKRNRGDSCDAESLGPGNRRHSALFPQIVVESRKIRNSPTEQRIKSNGRNVSVEVAGTININECKKKRATVADQNELQYDDFRVSKPSALQNPFGVGDIVWAKSDSRIDIPAWPAQVIDRVQDAPQSVQSIWVRQRHCVRFFGMKRSWDCEHAWVKEEMMLPFWESFGTLSYEGQKWLERCSKHLKGEFLEAIKEAYVAESSEKKQYQDRYQGEETICSSCSEKFPAAKLLESVKQLGNPSNKGALFCPRCYNLYECNQSCGICRKVWNPTLKRNWVQCEKCDIWVHADCDNISNEQLQDLIEYSCPHCTLKQSALRRAPNEENNRLFTVPERLTVVCHDKENKNSKPSTVPKRITVVCDDKEEKNNRHFAIPECNAVVCDGKEKKSNWTLAVPERITVVCNRREGHYVTKSHLILCECSECGNGRSMSLTRWERHVGCKAKKWKQSVKVIVSNQHLIDWLNNAHEAGAFGLGFFTPEGQVA